MRMRRVWSVSIAAVMLVRNWVEGFGNEVVFGGGVLSVLGVILMAYALTARPR